MLGTIAICSSVELQANSFAANGKARPLQYRNPNYPGLKEFDIDDPGTYVLAKNQIQQSQFWTGNGVMNPSGGYMVSINCGSVELDLQGHKLAADAKMGGISLFVEMNLGFAKRSPAMYAASLDNRFVVVRNGTIDLMGGKATQEGISFGNKWYGYNQVLAGRPEAGDGTVLQHIVYERNEYRFEQLKVFANDVALAAEGSHTLIRDCVIEAAGSAAIFIAGDHVTIENCEIRLRKPYVGKKDRLRAAIVLRDGSNAVIRNNRIRVDEAPGGSYETHCILVRDGAKDVLVEGNTFVNVKGEPVTLTEGAQAIVRGNKSEKSWL